MSKETTPPAAVTRFSPWLVGWFRWYLRGYLQKNFHAVALCREPRPQINHDDRLVVYLNHAAWWDPLVAQHLAAAIFPERQVFAPFEAEAISRYPLFERMGFFGVDKSSRRGAADFLRTAAAALDQPGGSLWLTPEGRFCDPRDGSAEFEPGLAHLAAKLAEDGRPATFLPVAIEYPFWEEKTPEALVRFGEPLRVEPHADYSKEAWRELLESRLRASQAALAELSIERLESAFEVLLGGQAGVGGLYGGFRRVMSRLSGKPYRASHGEKLQS